MRLENWSIVGPFDVYKAPEHQTKHLKGYVFGHPRFEDNTLITTSAIKKVNSRIVKTQNSEYELGSADYDYLQWCIENNTHLPLGETPIKVT